MKKVQKECWTVTESIVFEDETIQIVQTADSSYPAILYKRFFPAVSIGTKLVINQTATALNLGTGGFDFVKHVFASTRESEKNESHIMKLRYMPLQHVVNSLEERKELHPLFENHSSLQNKKIILAELHSMVPIIYDVAIELDETASCCFIFDDSASLTIEISSHIRRLQELSNFHSITIGQCIGGEFDAVSLASALQFAHGYLHADLIVISVGPGVVGTGTKYGHSAMDIANWANTVGALGGCPVWIPRLSFADNRDRHYGLSHHTITPLYEFTYCPCMLIFPPLQIEQKKVIEAQLTNVSRVDHQLIYSSNLSNEEAVRRVLSVGKVKTMGRGYNDDPVFFEAISEAVSFCLKGCTS
ncbi:DUF3866 family protein [Alkalicoccobacillus gibsonii]|uniref:DUF3866 family protein n=1 Tax=Alkalicoccobacillus gibsonii TaxID=79881 RepID=UPI00235F779A|nr:DUF3866 family protein [Alkalicoccobacillus gibsonii]